MIAARNRTRTIWNYPITLLPSLHSLNTRRGARNKIAYMKEYYRVKEEKQRSFSVDGKNNVIMIVARSLREKIRIGRQIFNNLFSLDFLLLPPQPPIS